MISTPVSLLLKILTLRSNQTFQITAKNLVSHVFCMSFLMCMLVQLSNSSLMILGMVQSLSQALNHAHHTCLVNSQNRNKCCTNSISFLHSTHILSMLRTTPSLLNLSLVFTLPTSTNHPKSSILRGTTPLQIELVKL
ncbi:uncharacterized protein DS421_5g170390 [Arachis hypogaea]|nr:uncharacterized protein DS421_5g170390 [Arachis hypogaea]